MANPDIYRGYVSLVQPEVEAGEQQPWQFSPEVVEALRGNIGKSITVSTMWEGAHSFSVPIWRALTGRKGILTDVALDSVTMDVESGVRDGEAEEPSPLPTGPTVIPVLQTTYNFGLPKEEWEDSEALMTAIETIIEFDFEDGSNISFEVPDVWR